MNFCKFEGCSSCMAAQPSHFCPCQAQPVVLCTACIGMHTLSNRLAIHEIGPIEALTYWDQPDYRESIKERMHNCEKAQTVAAETQAAIELWKRTACGVINDWMCRLAETRDQISLELGELQAELRNAIELDYRKHRDTCIPRSLCWEVPLRRLYLCVIP